MVTMKIWIKLFQLILLLAISLMAGNVNPGYAVRGASVWYKYLDINIQFLFASESRKEMGYKYEMYISPERTVKLVVSLMKSKEELTGILDMLDLLIPLKGVLIDPPVEKKINGISAVLRFGTAISEENANPITFCVAEYHLSQFILILACFGEKDFEMDYFFLSLEQIIHSVQYINPE